jgi:hypothetical protein
MVETLTEAFQREWNSINNDANDYNGNSNNNQSWHQRLLARKVSEKNNNNNHLQQQQSISEHNDTPSSPAVRTPNPLSARKSVDKAYDTDGAVGTSGNASKHHHHHHHLLNSSNNYEHLISPRLLVRRPPVQSAKQTASLPLQHQLSHKVHLAATTSINSSAHNHDDRDDDSNNEGDTRRRHIRFSRRVQQPPATSGNHGLRALHSSLSTVTPSIQPFRIIFMRHGERANQALGPDWFNKAFRTNTYRAYDSNLPRILPKRHFNQAYEFDAPLTGRAHLF